MQDTAEALSGVSGHPPGPMAVGLRKYVTGPLLSPWVKRNLSVYLVLLSQIQDYYKEPYYKVAQTIRDHPIVSRIPSDCYFVKMVLPSLDDIVTKNAEHDAAIDVARVSLGLKLFKQKNGAYPDTLDKLTPTFIDAIPLDPFTGKSLVYRKAGEGFVLYSFGPNQQDDNGTPQPTGKKATGKEPFDIVWKAAR